MGFLEIIWIIAGVMIGTFLWLHSGGNESGVAFGAVGGAMAGLGAAFVIRRISYAIFGYKRAKDSRD